MCTEKHIHAAVRRLAFYDALTKPQAIKDFYKNEELIAITKELADTLRRNKTIDRQKKNLQERKCVCSLKNFLKNTGILPRVWRTPFRRLWSNASFGRIT